MRLNPNAPLASIFIVCCVQLVVACGISDKPHYDETGKTFGRSSGNAEMSGTNEETGQTRLPVEEESPLPTDQLLSHYSFSGYFNLDQVRRITRGTDGLNGEISQGGMLDSMLSSLLGTIIGAPKTESLEMIVRQNGASQNLVTQKVVTNGGDNISNMKGDESQSGTQLIDWTLEGAQKNKGCPDGFVCIERMVWVPDSGQTMTYCYRDPVSKSPIAIPYSPNSQYGADSFAAVIGDGITSKPFEVSTHRGTVGCQDQGIEVIDRNLVIYRIGLGNLADQGQSGFLRKALNQSLEADTEVAIGFSLFNGTANQPYLPKAGPYIDQLTRLNTNIRFFLNTKEHVIVKLERTVQAPFTFESSTIADAVRETYGEAAAYVFDLLFPKDSDTMGAQLVYAFEFCTHLGVIQNPINHCSLQTTPQTITSR
jgi:hypothetical protein